MGGGRGDSWLERWSQGVGGEGLGQAGWPAPGQRQRRTAKFWQSVSRTYQPPGRTMSRESRSRHSGILSASWGSLERQAQPFFCLSPQGRVSRSGSRCYCCCCRRPRSCPQMSGSPCRVGGATPRPRGSLLPCPRPGPFPSSPAGPASPFSSRWLGGGRRLSLSVGWGLSEDPEKCGLGSGTEVNRVLCGERADRDLVLALGEGTTPLRPPHLFWAPSSPVTLPVGASVGGSSGLPPRGKRLGCGVPFLQSLTFWRPIRIPSPSEDLRPR